MDLKTELLQKARDEYIADRADAWQWFHDECDKLRAQRDEKISAAGELLHMKEKKIAEIDFVQTQTDFICPVCDSNHPPGCCARDGHGG